jgi:chromosome segregation ATPase
MARIGVTYDDISAAAQAVREQGMEPTVDRVREHLGTGSKSTIAPLLKRWRSDQASAVSELPDELLQAVTAIHARLQLAAEQRVRAETDVLEQERVQWQAQLQQGQQQIQALETQKADMEHRIHTDGYEKAALRQSLEETRLSIAKTETRLQDVTGRNQELNHSLADVRQENRDIREHFEHYQQRTAEDRQRERDEQRLIQQQQQQQIQQLSQLLSQSSQANQQLQQQAELLTQQKQQAEQGVQQLRIETQQLQAKLDNQIQQQEAVHNHLQDLEQELQSALTQQQQTAGELQHVQQDNRHLTQQLASEMRQQQMLEQLLQQLRDENQRLLLQNQRLSGL